MNQTIRYEEDGELARITLVRSRINMEMVRELTAVCDHLEDKSECKVVVLQGSDGRFCEGIDFAEFKPDQPMDIHGFNKWEKISARIERLPKAIIAVVDGPARGGGAQLALVADAVVATPNSTIQFDEVQHGFLPGMATFRLAKVVGLGHAKRLIMQSPVVTAAEAQQLGIVSSVSTDVEVALAETIRAFGPIHNVAVTLARRLLNESFSTGFENAIGNFLAAQHRAIHQTPFLETIKKHQDE
jgi:enoyl-CoA hydratase